MLLIRITGEEITYQFSVNEVKSIWDNKQWSEAYLWEEIPVEFQTEVLKQLCECVKNIKPRIDKIMEDV